MVFKKEKMIERLTKEGRANMITDEILAIMDNMDGCEASEQNWERQVKGEPVLYVYGKDGRGNYVNEEDCE